MSASVLFKKALLYFALVFGAGFVLGVVRVLVLIPMMPERYAELLEMPLMLAVIYFSARYIVRASGQQISAPAALGVGLLALALLLLVEFTLVLGLRGLTLAEYIESRDVVSGTAYAVSLIFFALAPWLFQWNQRR